MVGWFMAGGWLGNDLVYGCVIGSWYRLVVVGFGWSIVRRILSRIKLLGGAYCLHDATIKTSFSIDFTITGISPTSSKPHSPFSSQ